jgi:hypothetical protein
MDQNMPVQTYRGSELLSRTPALAVQRPKNNHNRIITGIGTPSSQSKSPRPIFASIIVCVAPRTPSSAPRSIDRQENSGAEICDR